MKDLSTSAAGDAKIGSHDSEWWLCGECLHVGPSHTWGIEGGNTDTAVCPGCGYVHRDDECSWIDTAWTEHEIWMLRRQFLAEREAETG